MGLFTCVIVLIWSLLSIYQIDSMVSICQNVTIVATEFRLGRSRSDSADCNCRLVSTDNKTNTINVQISAIDGCQYRLLVDYERKHASLSCDTEKNWATTVNMETEILYFTQEPYKPTNDGADFALNITSLSDVNLTLTCFTPTLTTSNHLPSPTTQWPSSTTTLPSSTNTTNALLGVLMNTVSLYGIGIGCFTGGIVVGVVCHLEVTRCRRRRKEENNDTFTLRNEEEFHTHSEAGDAENLQNNTKIAYFDSVPQESVYENT